MLEWLGFEFFFLWFYEWCNCITYLPSSRGGLFDALPRTSPAWILRINSRPIFICNWVLAKFLPLNWCSTVVASVVIHLSWLGFMILTIINVFSCWMLTALGFWPLACEYPMQWLLCLDQQVSAILFLGFHKNRLLACFAFPCFALHWSLLQSRRTVRQARRACPLNTWMSRRWLQWQSSISRFPFSEFLLKDGFSLELILTHPPYTTADQFHWSLLQSRRSVRQAWLACPLNTWMPRRW